MITSDVDYVVHQKARGLRLTPHHFAIAKSGSQQIKTVALDQFQHPLRVVGTPTYTLLAGSGSISTSGLFTATSRASKVDIEVMLNGLTGTIGGTVA